MHKIRYFITKMSNKKFKIPNFKGKNQKIAHKILKCAEKSVPLHTERKFEQFLLRNT